MLLLLLVLLLLVLLLLVLLLLVLLLVPTSSLSQHRGARPVAGRVAPGLHVAAQPDPGLPVRLGPRLPHRR